MDSNKEHQLVTIITESLLEDKIAQDLEFLGAHGYTVTDARGKGDRGLRSSDWCTNKNIRIEVVCCIDVARAIMRHMQKNYFANYAIIVFKHQVDVVREYKF
jgi:nitrogen regulatory protein PII